MVRPVDELVHVTIWYHQQERDLQVTLMEKDGQPVFQCVVDGNLVIDLTMNDSGCWESVDRSEAELSHVIGDIIEQKTM